VLAGLKTVIRLGTGVRPRDEHSVTLGVLSGLIELKKWWSQPHISRTGSGSPATPSRYLAGEGTASPSARAARSAQERRSSPPQCPPDRFSRRWSRTPGSEASDALAIRPEQEPGPRRYSRSQLARSGSGTVRAFRGMRNRTEVSRIGRESHRDAPSLSPQPSAHIPDAAWRCRAARSYVSWWWVPGARPPGWPLSRRRIGCSGATVRASPAGCPCPARAGPASRGRQGTRPAR
jgi:hypothetical protein